MTTLSNAVELALELDMSLGESPLWSVARQTLHWVDINHGVILLLFVCVVIVVIIAALWLAFVEDDTKDVRIRKDQLFFCFDDHLTV